MPAHFPGDLFATWPKLQPITPEKSVTGASPAQQRFRAGADFGDATLIEAARQRQLRVRQKRWAREDQRSLSNLTYRLISRAIVEEEQRRGHPFESTKTERKSL